MMRRITLLYLIYTRIKGIRLGHLTIDYGQKVAILKRERITIPCIFEMEKSTLSFIKTCLITIILSHFVEYGMRKEKFSYEQPHCIRSQVLSPALGLFPQPLRHFPHDRLALADARPADVASRLENLLPGERLRELPRIWRETGQPKST